MKTIILIILRVIAAAIMLQTLYFKFTGHPDSVAIFTELGMEPGGRILIGVLELTAAILLLVPVSVAWGALLAAGLMTGALIAHLTQLGFEGKMASLGGLAGAVLLISLVLLFFYREQMPFISRALEKE